MNSNLRILFHQGRQYIPDIEHAVPPGLFRGRPVISNLKVDEQKLVELCPTGAITAAPVSIDLGKCTFCGECAVCFPEKISFTKDNNLSTNIRSGLIVREGADAPISVDPEQVRAEIHRCFGRSLKLRQVSAGGDNSCELELNAANNVQFDMTRFGIDFVASPRHADGLVVTGPISANMAEALERCWEAIPEPKVLILAGTDAISGGIFAGSPALDRHFLDTHPVDLYIAGNPVHPLTFIKGVIQLTRKLK
jgi:Ni,Fe-hydrogenase III small subunit